ncbi:MAG: NAD(P)/FAD-dependent oxidoreductase [Caulobacteraceae bacterium]
MSGAQDLRVLVAGGGAMGSVAALALARAGARVTLADPAGLGDNASGIAAGMLAPAFESLFDDASPPLDLLRRARDLWPELAASVGLELSRTGAMAVGTEAQVEAWGDTLAGLGIDAQRLSPAQARERSPWLAAGLSAAWTGEDWRVEPLAALAALRSAAERLGTRRVGASVTAFEGGMATLSDGARLTVDALVVATGASASLAGLAPELASLRPIKGHILTAPGLALAGPVVRLEKGYICPARGGALIGSTMQAGRADTRIEPAEVRRLRDLATRAAPILAGAVLAARAGVRAATPDGLPMVGASRAAGVWLAVGARRNGWLLAPLIAEALVDAMAARRAGAWAPTFDPARFAAAIASCDLTRDPCPEPP